VDKPATSLLDKALVRIDFSGATFNAENLYVDQATRIASFQTNTDLRNIAIGNRKTDVYINHVDFVVAGQTRVVFVDLVYLASDGISVFQELQSFLDSLHFTG